MKIVIAKQIAGGARMLDNIIKRFNIRRVQDFYDQ